MTTTVLFTLYAISIALAIRKVTGNYIDREFVKNILKIVFAGVSALAVFLMFRLVMPSVMGDRVLFLIPLATCGVVYVGVLWVSGIVEIVLKSKNAGIPQNEGAEK